MYKLQDCENRVFSSEDNDDGGDTNFYVVEEYWIYCNKRN